MASSIHNLRKRLENPYNNERFQKFDGQGRLVLIVAHYLIKLCSKDDAVITSLQQLGNSVGEEDSFFNLFRSFVGELQAFFAVPNSSTLKPNELLAVFIDFLLEILQEILSLQPYFILPSKESFQTLKMELKFLITFLGDTPLQHIETETTNHILTDIGAVANDVGTFLYSFFFTMDRDSLTGMDWALSDLLEKVEQMKENIKRHCIKGLKMPGRLTPMTAVVSPALVDSLLDDLRDLINHDDERIADVKDQIGIIHDKLMFLLSLLREIELKRYPNLEKFLIRIGEIAYEVEYIINLFAPVWYLTLRLLHIMEKIELIEKQLQKNKMKDAEYPSQLISLQTQKPPIEEETVVGFDNEETIIVEQLVRGPDYLQIISIFGMPGLGKTTLAKKLYDSSSIIYHFHKRAWCVVSQTYQKRNTLIDILMSTGNLITDAMMEMDDESLAEKLYQSLCGRRYLVVMDDIWCEEVWRDLKRYFPDGRLGNRILFTTQIENFSLFASPPIIVNPLHFLSDDEAWDLLKRKLFNLDLCPLDLVCTGKKIASKCRGLPLAVVLIAPVLADLKKETWKDVAQSLSSHIFKGPRNCMMILILSYNNLPVHLKPCFLYFIIFKEGREISVRKLISLWIAEGFIEKVENKSSEEVAREYLTDLIKRGHVLVAKRRSVGGVKTCKVHDLLLEMCLTTAEKYNFLKVIKDQLSVYEQHHRLSIQSHSIPSFSRPFGLHFHSLSGHLPDPSPFIFCNMKRLKVLDLSTIDMRLYNPTGIEVLILLKFLAVSSILSSRMPFKNLEFLFVDNKEEVQIPDFLLNMVKLRRLHFSGGAHFSESCLVSTTSNLKNISFLHIKSENGEKTLRCSPYLRRLKCKFTLFWDSSAERYRFPNLEFLDKLESLSVSNSSSFVFIDVDSDLIRFPRNLKKLTIHDFDLSWRQMTIIGELHNLAVLKLQDDTIEGEEWVKREGDFKQLKFLELDGVEIESWETSSAHFPILGRLVLRNCQSLNIPSSIGYIPTMNMIEVHDCSQSVADSAVEIEKEQQNMGNDESLSHPPQVY